MPNPKNLQKFNEALRTADITEKIKKAIKKRTEIEEKAEAIYNSITPFFAPIMMKQPSLFTFLTFATTFSTNFVI